VLASRYSLNFISAEIVAIGAEVVAVLFNPDVIAGFVDEASPFP
jgi:hypothetical protein